MNKKIVNKLFAFICILSIFIQSLSLFAVLTKNIVYAEDISPVEAPTVEAPTEEITPTTDLLPIPTETISLTPATEIVPVDKLDSTQNQDQASNNNLDEEKNNPISEITASPTAEQILTPEPTKKTGNEKLGIAILDNTSAPSIDLEAVISEGSAILVTDKPDYAPTDTALITGVNLLPNTVYILIVSSSNSPPVNFSTEVTSDENGVLGYAYQLDGIYRPNYSVELKNQFGYVVATASFTDSDGPYCDTDLQLANDQPGQKDLTKMCATYSVSPSTINVNWNWDEIAGSGANTFDACSLYDTDLDGFANFSICVTVQGKPLIQSANSPRIYSCNDANNDRCSGGSLIAGPYNTTCSVFQQGTDPFPAGADFPQDTTADCIINLTEVGGISSKLIDVCSYPSQQPNSDPSDCIKTSTANQTGTIELKKIWEGTPGQTTLNIGTTAGASDVDTQLTGINGSFPLTTGINIVSTGTYYLSETGGINNYTSSLSCTKNNESYTPGENQSVIIDNNDDVICTFTNTEKLASVNVTKVATEDSVDAAGDVIHYTIKVENTGNQTLTGVSVSDPLINGNLDCDGTPGAPYVRTGLTINVGNTKTCVGTYIVTQDDIDDYGGRDGDIDNTVTVDSDQTDTDTASDTVLINGSITIIKVDNLNSGQDFVFNYQPMGIEVSQFTLDDDNNNDSTHSDRITYSNLSPNFYDINEVKASGWTPSVVECTSNYSSFTPQHVFENGAISIYLRQGENIICTFTNVRDTGKIELQKDFVGTAENVTIKIGTSQGGNEIYNGNLSEDGTSEEKTVLTNNYFISETLTTPANYTVILACYNDVNDNNLIDEGDTSHSVNTTTGEVTIDKGDDVICRYINTRNTGTVNIVKDINPNDDTGLFDLQIDGVTKKTNAGDGDETGKITLETGNYAIGEIAGTSTNLTDYTTSVDCVDEQTQQSVIDGPRPGWTIVPVLTVNKDQNIVCTFSNTRLSKIIVVKYNDKNGNGQVDENEEKMSDWTINLTEQVSQVTDENGQVVFDNLLPNKIYTVSENLKPGWEQTAIFCEPVEPKAPPADQLTLIDSALKFIIDEAIAVALPTRDNLINLKPGEEVLCKILNHSLVPILTITKENDSISDELPGGSVMYTLTITATQSAVNDVFLTDLLPEGFKYRSGSWTAVSSERGDISSLGEPVYASPGKWTLGNMKQDEVVTLTYIADIANEQKAGLYKDVAWAEGTSLANEKILALALPLGYVDENFVGTEVNIASNYKPGASVEVVNEITKDVLGASTSLPGTGGNTFWPALAILMFLSGLSSVGIGYAIRRRYE